MIAKGSTCQLRGARHREELAQKLIVYIKRCGKVLSCGINRFFLLRAPRLRCGRVLNASLTPSGWIKKHSRA